MGWARITPVALFLAVLVGVTSQVCLATVYKVGDSAGWTTIGKVDYKQWAATKTFHVGDIILFEYNPQFHNLMQVNHTEYRSCTPTSLIATYTTGNDSITIRTPGHHFFMCGVPGHCQSGQKVDINVLRTHLTPPPSISPSPSIPVPAPALAPTPSRAAPLHALGGLFVKVVKCMTLCATLVLGF